MTTNVNKTSLLAIEALPGLFGIEPKEQHYPSKTFTDARTNSHMCSMVLYVLGIVLAVLPPLILYVVKGLGVVGVHDYIGVTPRTLILCMLASAPLSHLSGVVSWRDYNLIMPLAGGFEV